MRKLKPSDVDSLEFIKGIINSTNKRKGEENLPIGQTYKEKCLSTVDDNKDYIETYDTVFDANTLQSLEGTHPVLSTSDKDRMRSLYSYPRTLIANLRKNVLTEDGYENNFCPLCEINLVNTMDHFIPQNDYPLLAVHPRNLIPSCSMCNGHKSDSITDGNGNRKFWNAYIDTPPTESYLFCDVIEKNGLPTIHFYIKQGNIDNETFRLIKNTMDDKGQKMFNVFKMVCGKIISELKNQVIQYFRKSGQPLDKCFQVVKMDIENNFEPNKCEDVVKKALIESSLFQSCVEKELKRLDDKYIV